MKNKNRNASVWILLSVFVIVLDQFTKQLVLQNISVEQVVPIFPFLNFILRFNAGAAFSFLGSQNGWQLYLLSGISVIISAVLIIWLCRLKRSDCCTAVPISLILGGALGNLIDRVHYGCVVDFIDFHVGNWHYATFNVADSAVCIGAILLVLRLLYEGIARKS
ncbi:MAG: signal peptidase II [Gammaproteobacteria bacterium]|nr:signal peptidase II [Gammaproteobacteria bacterium]